MSQYPPPPGQPQQPIPPMSPAQPGGGAPGTPAGGYTVPPGGRTSGMAIASLICSLIVCGFGVTSLIGTILGVVGLKQTSNPSVRGRGLALAGLLLGVLGLIGWACFYGAMGFAALKVSGMMKEVHAPAKQFVQDLAAGHIDAAAARADSQFISTDQLKSWHEQMTQWGTLNDLTLIPANVNVNNGVGDADIAGAAQFSKNPQSVKMHMKKPSGGDWKVTEIEFHPLGGGGGGASNSSGGSGGQ